MRLLLLALWTTLAAASTPVAGDAPTITAAELESHVRFLAADVLQGRDTGSDEAMLAAGYLAAQLERAGLEGAVDDGGFLQAVPVHRTVAIGTPALEADGDATRFRHGEHFSIYRRPATNTGPLRLVHVAAADELPPPSPALALDLEGSRRDVRQRFEDAGIPDGEGYGLILLRGRTSEGKPRGPVRTRGLSRGEPDSGDRPAWLVCHGALRDALEAGAVSEIAFDGQCELESVPAANVVARIAGVGTAERPELAEEAIVISAHYDHIGTLEVDEEGAAEASEVDVVFNGADDDASGVAAVVEVARALAAGPAPAREVVILLATGEEKGLIGTEYYLDHPVVPLERTACNLNIEMIGRADALVGGAGKVWYTGPDETTLLAEFNAAGIPVARDPYPEMNYYRRSDNYAFVVRGVIGQTFSTYDGHEDYHRVSDEADTLDYEHMAGATNTILAAIRAVADGAIDPAWAEGKGAPQPR